jgi:hypothetical protein
VPHAQIARAGARRATKEPSGPAEAHPSKTMDAGVGCKPSHKMNAAAPSRLRPIIKRQRRASKLGP